MLSSISNHCVIPMATRHTVLNSSSSHDICDQSLSVSRGSNDEFEMITLYLFLPMTDRMNSLPKCGSDDQYVVTGSYSPERAHLIGYSYPH